MKIIHPKKDLPVIQSIRSKLMGCSTETKMKLLNGLTEDQFITVRTHLFLHELDTLLSNGLEPIKAEELAFLRCMEGIE